MKYLVLEIQKNLDGTVIVAPIYTYDNYLQAESTYHTILASAAISTIYQHTVVLLNEVGNVVKRESYTHLPENA